MDDKGPNQERIAPNDNCDLVSLARNSKPTIRLLNRHPECTPHYFLEHRIQNKAT